MILLDTNYMIAVVNRDPDAHDSVKKWMQQGQRIATSSAAWSEFCTGPIDRDDMVSMEWLLEDRVLGFGKAEAERAAHLYRAARCRRDDRIDTFIAASAIVASALLATRDRRGFERFVPFGLKLV